MLRNNLHSLLDSKGVSQYQLADKLNVSPPAISRLVNARGMSPQWIERISNELQVEDISKIVSIVKVK
ncbi:helix-turn-helix domain-containing protein [Virgibacillus natechei]